MSAHSPAALLVAAGIVLAGCVGGTPPSTSTPSSTPTQARPAAPATSQELIGDAVREGRIDAGTSLVYRAFALFGDARLPAEYAAAPSAGEDAGLYFAARDAGLSPETRALLEPFLVRPSDPVSAWNAEAAFSVLSSHEPPPAALPCEEGWAHLDAAGGAVRLWAKCVAGADAAADLQHAASLVEAVWRPMVALMGAPRPDLTGTDAFYPETVSQRGGTNATDVYLVRPALGEAVVRPGAEAPSPLSGVAPPSEPWSGVTASGYVIVSRDSMRLPVAKSLLAHELFHVMQYAHNAEVIGSSVAVGGGSVDFEYWFAEASAVWAETRFARETANERVYKPRFAGGFQVDASGLPLDLSLPFGDPHLYDAFVWPFFMEQESGAGVVASAWRAIGASGAATSQAANDALESVFSMDERFDDFAVRNLNTALGNAIPKRYVAHDAVFPDALKPAEGVLLAEWDLAAPGTLPIPIDVPAASGRYHHMDPSDALRVKVRFEGLEGAGALTVDALVKARDKDWERRSLPTDRETTLCDVEELYLVVANAARNAQTPTDKTATGSMVLTSDLVPCKCDGVLEIGGWSGRIEVDYDATIEGATASGGHVTVAMKRKGTLDFTTGPPTQSGAYGVNKSGHGSLADVVTYVDEEGRSSTSTENGEGDAKRATKVSVFFDLRECVVWLLAELQVPGNGPDGECGCSSEVFIINPPKQPLAEPFAVVGSASLAAGRQMSDPYAVWPGVALTGLQAQWFAKHGPFVDGGWPQKADGSWGEAKATWNLQPLPPPKET